MAITAKQVSKLRKLTSAGMMDCKKALEKSGGNLEAAVDILRKKGQKLAAKRADRETLEGNVFVYTSEDGGEGITFALNCETEPVSKTEEFTALGKAILVAAITNKPINKESLLTLNTASGQVISEAIVDLTAKIGEKIEVSQYTYAKGEKVVSYKHGNTIAVLVTLSARGNGPVTQAGKDVAMQIAAMNPLAVSEENVEAAIIEKEKEIGMERARQEGKPEHILDKIAAGYIKKFLQENTLLNQTFVKDNKQTVQQYLNSIQRGLTVTAFERIAIGR